VSQSRSAEPDFIIGYQSDPVVPGILIADVSSNFCSKPIDVSKYGVRERATVGPDTLNAESIHARTRSQ
jgi:hypothetical protein